MNILKQHVAVFSSLIFLLVAVVDTAAADDYADGKLGQALTLDGESQSVKIPHYAGLKPLRGITVSAWIKPERVTKGRDSWQMIYGKPERHGHGFMAIGEYEKKHSLYFELKTPGFGNRIRHGFPLEPAKLLDGKWHLVCATYDGKAMTFYADGQEIGVKAVKGQIDTQGKAPAYIGSKRGREQFFKGGIDDVRVYNRALSADEIETMALADGEATVAGLAGWWKLDGNLKNSATWAPKTLHAALNGPHNKEMTVSKKYLLLPIVNAANHHFDDAFVDMQTISLVVDGKEVRHVKAGLAEKKEDADWWAFFDVSAYKGKTLAVTVQPTHTEAFALITQSDTVPGEDKWGTEPERPQFHFSQKVGWNNDPNGMVYYKGEWHLYFQHNPVALPWGKGNMTWGHAVSKDLVSWRQLPNVFHSRRTKSGEVDDMYSGGAVVDWKNTGGWKTGENDVIVVTWTSTGRGECVAYSNDKGRTFTEYEGNPVIPLVDGGRDPKPLWYEYGKQDKPLSDKAAELGGHWVIARVCMNKKDGNSIGFYSSTNLKQWRFESQLPGFFECAELFTLPVDGNKEKLRWVVFAADAEYAIGDFDGKTFTPEHQGKHRLHHGKYYASQLFSDAPDGRRIQIGWGKGIGNDFSRNPGEGLGWPDSTFNQTFSFPTELSLRTTKDGVRMFGEPVKEIEKILGKCSKATATHLTPEKPVEVKTSGALLDIRAEFELGKAKTVGLEVDGKKVATFDVSSGKLNDQMPLQPVDGKIAIRILIDRPMMEIFANHGEQIATLPYENDLNIESVKAFCDGGDAKLRSLEVYQLNAKWGYSMAQPPVTAPGITRPVAANDVSKAAEQSPDGKGKQDKVSTPMVNNAWGNLYGFHQSRAHYRSGKTYLAWVGPDNHPYVSVYSHKMNEWSAHKRVGTNLISPKDYHGNPSILIDREGFLHVFYGGHNEKMRYSRSTKPLSNDDWQDYTSRLPYTDSTYPQLFTMSDGTIYSFYRRKTHRGNWSYVTSKDNGSTWSKEVHVLDGSSPPGNGWYTAFTKDPNRDHIHLMFLWHASKDNLPHSRRNLYYMHMDHSTGKWTGMENEKLNTPLSFEEANGKVMIFDSKNKYSSIPQLWLTVDGRPVGLNRTGTNNHDKDGQRQLHVWTGESWRTHKVPIDVLLKPAKNEWVGFRSREGTVQKFTSADEGAHWTPGEIILKTDGEQKLNALFAEAHPDAVLLIYDKVDAQRVPGKQRLWVWGDAGFLKTRSD